MPKEVNSVALFDDYDVGSVVHSNNLIRSRFIENSHESEKANTVLKLMFEVGRK